jgi:adenosylcobinamide-GDP ribazoletransferase
MTSIIKEWLVDLRAAVAFLTRVPMPHPHGPVLPNFARAHRAFPLVGGAIGAFVGLVYLVLAAGLPNLAAAALALGAGAILTGALHEDGLADVADGFGGGWDRPAKLEIMLDSRLGTYGALMLLVSFAAKLSALARGVLPVMAMTMPYARKEGLAATAGKPDQATAITAIALALTVAFVALPWTQALGAAVVAAAAAVAMAVLAQRQIGGQTGDVLGAAEQIAETAILLFLAAHIR